MDTDFIGFQYDGINSRDFDLYRVSISNRYEEQLIPQFNENKTAVPGGDGTYFFDANYTQRQFKVSFAFDSLTETQYRQLRLWLGNKDTFKQLIFDERPYKYYMAKPSAPPTLKTICFDEEYIENNVVKTKRIYKGEGEVTFVCYYPFARTRYGLKYSNQFSAAPDCSIDFCYYSEDGTQKFTGKTEFSQFSSVPSDYDWAWQTSKTQVYYTIDNQTNVCSMKEFYDITFIRNIDGVPTPFNIKEFKPKTPNYPDIPPYFKTTAGPSIPVTSFTGYSLVGFDTNLSQWENSVSWLSTKGDFDTFITTDSTATAYLYNPGDLSADYKITLDYIPESIFMVNDSFGEVKLVHFSNQDWPTITIPTTTNSNGTTIATTTTTSANRIQIDSKTNMIKVGTTADSTSVAAVDFVPVEMFNTAADVMNFVTIPVDTQDTLIGVPASTADANTRIVITGIPSSGSPSASIDYDYLYY